MPIWARYRNAKKVEKVDDRDSEELLQEYRRRFGALEGQPDANDWKLWRGRQKDEPRDEPTR
jgi:hypothetical protein